MTNEELEFHGKTRMEQLFEAEKQIAAEREKGQSLVDTLKAAHEDCKRANDNYVRLEQQLATVRELREHDQKQLAAEREKREYWEQAYKQLLDATTGKL